MRGNAPQGGAVESAAMTADHPLGLRHRNQDSALHSHRRGRHRVHMAIITRRRDFVLSSRDGAHGRVTSPGHCGRSSVGASGWEPVAAGRLDLPEAWNGYATAFPDYVIYPRVVAEPGQGQVAVLGHTTGSHLGLSDQEEPRLSIIWLAETENGRLLQDTPARRLDLGLG